MKHVKGCNVCGTPGPGSKFGNVRAQEQGWFFQKNGDMYCPEHVPEWVAEWRAKKKEKSS